MYYISRLEVTSTEKEGERGEIFSYMCNYIAQLATRKSRFARDSCVIMAQFTRTHVDRCQFSRSAKRKACPIIFPGGAARRVQVAQAQVLLTILPHFPYMCTRISLYIAAPMRKKKIFSLLLNSNYFYAKLLSFFRNAIFNCT